MIKRNFPEEDIDIVYTWVDGSDPLFVSEKRKYARQYEPGETRDTSSANRFRDNGELLFSLRSVEKFAPWVRKIHIVTNGQVPAWLNTDCERISVVTHEQIFSNRDHLPVFNSNAIEMNLHRINGLSRRFLYLNDDLFLNKHIDRSDFTVDRSGQYFFFDNTPLYSNCHQGRVHDRAYAHTQMVARRLHQMDVKRRLPSHCPQLYDRDVLYRLEELFQDAFIETSSHRFRDPQDIVLRILYAIYIFETAERNKGHEQKTLPWNPDEYIFLMLNSHVWPSVKFLAVAGLRRPRFLCINDDIETSDSDRMVRLAFRMLLRWLFPWPSKFEKRKNGLLGK